MIDLSQAKGPVLPVGSDLMLRPLLVEDVTARYVDSLNDPTVAQFLVSFKAGAYTVQSVSRMVQENFDAADATLFGMFSSGDHFGNIRLHDVSHDSAFIGIAIFDRSRQGKGLAAKAIATVARYGTCDLGVRNIFAGIDDRNAASIRAFGKAGFVRFSGSSDPHGQIWRLAVAGKRQGRESLRKT